MILYKGRWMAIILIIMLSVVAGAGLYMYWDELFPSNSTEPFCGDGICGNNETWLTCPADCNEPQPEYCGNGICESQYGENCITCPDDCGSCPPDEKGLNFRLPYNTVHTGDVFYVETYLDPEGREIGGWKISVEYDSSKLEALQVTTGNSAIWPKATFDEGLISNGEITYIQAWTMSDFPSFKTNLCVIKFKALNSGTADLDFSYVKIWDGEGTTISINDNSNSLIIR